MRSWLNPPRQQRLVRPRRISDLRLRRGDIGRVPGMSRIVLYKARYSGRVSEDMIELLTPLVRAFQRDELRFRVVAWHWTDKAPLLGSGPESKSRGSVSLPCRPHATGLTPAAAVPGGLTGCGRRLVVILNKS
jgi:hypothetical protein